MKLVIILYLGAVFAREENSRGQRSDTLFVHYVILLSIVGLVFIEPDLGTALVLFSVGYSMFFLAGVSSKQLAKMSLSLIPFLLVFFLYTMQLVPFFTFRFLLIRIFT